MCTGASLISNTSGKYQFPIFCFAGRELEFLRQELRKTRKAAFAQGTKKNLHTQWKSYIMFCTYFKLVPLPAEKDTLCLYAQFLARSFKSVDTIRNYLSGVKLMHTLSDTNCPHFGSVELKLSLRGMEQLKKHTPTQALPITPDILLMIHKCLNLHNKFHIVFWALSLVAFYTMSRKSNLVPTSIKSFDPRKQLCREDITLSSDCMLVRYKWSKRVGKRVHYIPLMELPGSALCPVNAYRNMVRVIRAEPKSPAFLVPNRQGYRPMTYQQLQNMLKKVIAIIGLNPASFSSHSYRRGGATTAFRANVPPELIQVQGDWKSDVYKTYLSFNLKDRAMVSSMVGEYAKKCEAQTLYVK